MASMSLTRAAIYTRVSLEGNGTSESPERQESDCRSLAQQRGWEVVEVYTDRDSAYSQKVRRPKYEQMMRDLRSGRADALVVWKLDRLTRQGLTGVGPVLELVRDRGLHLVSVTESLDTTTPMGRGMVGMLASMAEQESENTSLRVKRAHESSAANGKMHGGGSRQFGLTREGTLVPEEAQVVREAMERALAGESLRSIAADLNRRGVKTPNAGKARKVRGRDETYTVPGEWQSVTLGQMLRSPRLAGIRVHNGDVVKGGWDPIISEDEHHQLLRALSGRGTNRTIESRSHLLSGAGVIRCALCGRPMRRMSFRMANGRMFDRYQCARQPGQTQCGKVAITQASTDAFVIDELLYFLTVAEVRPLEGDESEAELEAELAEARAAMGELVQERFVRRKISREEYQSARVPLEAEEASLQTRLAALRRAQEERSLAIPLGDRAALDRWWDGASPEERIGTVRQAIRTVTIHPARRRGGNQFDDSRVDIDWRYDIFRT
jgi:site-specific DNA recombinase